LAGGSLSGLGGLFCQKKAQSHVKTTAKKFLRQKKLETGKTPYQARVLLNSLSWSR
jgi:hypothetical protein